MAVGSITKVAIQFEDIKDPVFIELKDDNEESPNKLTTGELKEAISLLYLEKIKENKGLNGKKPVKIGITETGSNNKGSVHVTLDSSSKDWKDYKELVSGSGKPASYLDWLASWKSKG